MSQAYNDPIGGSASSVGGQIRTDYYLKKALIETVEIHIDMSVRKSAEMSDAIFETLVRMREEHKSFGAYPFETRLHIK